MEIEVIKTKHYIRLDEQNRVVKGFSTAFEEPLETDICVCEDGGRHFELFGVINLPLINKDGICLYKYENGAVLKRAAEEIQADVDAKPKPPMSEIDLLKAQVKAATVENEFLSDCIIELAQVVYA